MKYLSEWDGVQIISANETSHKGQRCVSCTVQSQISLMMQPVEAAEQSKTIDLLSILKSTVNQFRLKTDMGTSDVMCLERTDYPEIPQKRVPTDVMMHQIGTPHASSSSSCGPVLQHSDASPRW
jgi:hypothetical protein